MSKPVVFSGNRCSRCGGVIDDGGVCPCGYDHNQKADYGNPDLWKQEKTIEKGGQNNG